MTQTIQNMNVHRLDGSTFKCTLRIPAEDAEALVSLIKVCFDEGCRSALERTKVKAKISSTDGSDKPIDVFFATREDNDTFAAMMAKQAAIIKGVSVTLNHNGPGTGTEIHVRSKAEADAIQSYVNMAWYKAQAENQPVVEVKVDLPTRVTESLVTRNRQTGDIEKVIQTEKSVD